MPAYSSLRKLDQNAYNSGNMVPTKIKNVEYGRDLLLYLQAEITTGTTPTIAEDSPMNLISNLDLVGASASGDPTKAGSIHRLAGIDLFALNAFETGTWPYHVRHGSANATDYDIAALLVLPFTTFPTDSLNLLPHPAFSDLELDVTWAAQSVLGTNLNATWVDTPTLTIYEASRKVSPVPTPSMMKTVTKYSTLTASSTDGNDIDIKTGLPIQSILVRVMDNSIRSDSFVTGLSLVENDTIFHIGPNFPWTLFQAYNNYRGERGVGMAYPFVEAADSNTATPVGLGVTNRATMKGFLWVDLVDLEGQPILVPGASDTLKLRLYTGASGGGTPAAYAVLRQRIG